ncbi:hypothetical protein [Mesorhizobium muleiense]|uniref:hypothetical protein n=1 Tax=Mesorhizobium muleiense TaxID=1004279 RepID=UPI001F42CE44|nr:hypothetical protein [Mesorhizobium muleiense]MCF6112223.1 hypothetical protein [Mesorhizobium muleiense]
MIACDVVTLTRQTDVDLRLGRATENYQLTLERLGDDPTGTSAVELLGKLIGAHKAFLAEAAQALSPDAYLSSPQCRVVVSLAPDLGATLRSEKLTGPLAAQRSNVIAIVGNLEADLESFLSRARFQSDADRLAASAGMLCMAAAVIDAAQGELSQDAVHPLEAYGETVGCDRVNRIGSEWPSP